MRALAILICVLCLAACQRAQTAPQGRVFAPETGRVVTADDPPELMQACMHVPGHDDRWTPAEHDIAMLGPVLIELIEYRLKEQNLTYEDTTEMRPEQYHRNYYGIVQDDWRFILVCGRYEDAPIAMHDGGPSQFGALFDTRRRTFTWFEFGHRA